MSTQQQQSLGPINPCTCPDRVENQLYREGYVEHPSVPLVSDPKCKRCFPGWVARWIVADDPNPEYWLNGSELRLGYKLDRPDRVLQDAFDGISEEVQGITADMEGTFYNAG